MASYGSISPSGGDAEPIRRRGNSKLLLGVAAIAAMAACTLMFLAATPSGSKPVALELQPVGSPPAPPAEEEHDDEEPVSMPFPTDSDKGWRSGRSTAEDFTSYEDSANEVLEYLGFSLEQVEDETDLDESCGDLMLPCLSTVGHCVSSNIHSVDATGRLEVDPETCQCFALGLTDKIPVDDSDDTVQCTFSCLDAISSIFDEKLFAHNEDSHTTVACPRTFVNMARSVYGTSNGDFPVQAEMDGEQTLPVDDEKVIRAAEALQEHVNLVRKQECNLKPQLTGTPIVLFDEKGTAKGAYGQYRLEVVLGAEDEMFTGRVVHLPKEDQMMNPSEADMDEENLLGRFRVMRLSPDPCAEGMSADLAITRSQVKAINAQKLSWKAKYDPEHHEGVTRDRFGLGFKPPSKEVRKQKTIQKLANAADIELPEAFDARDHRASEQYCRAYDIMDQGACGSCYAFAAATALSGRICKDTERKWNVIISPQEMLDCNNGCDGGYSLYVYEHITNDGGFAVENFCDPYTSSKSVCGGVCAAGNDFHGLDGTSYLVGDASEAGVKEMMREILLHGPGVFGFDMYDDFQAYSEGVYTRTSENYVGGHAVAVIGWGTEDGVDYWLLQNSWGKHVGDEGVWKIRRGTDECQIESYGLTVMTPELPAECPQTTCANGGTPMKDCSCRCKGGWSGPTCDTCSLTCQNGGVLADDCYSCYCPPGRWGDDCGGVAELSETAICQGSTDPLTVSFTYTTTEPPTQMSYLGVYAPDEESIYKFTADGSFEGYTHQSFAYMCGTSYNPESNGGLCGSTVTVDIPVWLLPAGDYKVALVRYLPPNEFGQDGYMDAIKPAEVIGVITVTDDCSAASMSQLESDNDYMPGFEAAVAAKQQEEAADQAAAEQRLDHAESFVTSLATAAPEATLEITGVDGTNPTIWSSAGPITVCAVIPMAANTNPKHLVLFVGDGSSGSFYPTGLINQGPSINAPESNEFCVDTGVSAGIPGGQYTLGLQSDHLLASVTFEHVSAWVGIMDYTPREGGTSGAWKYLDIKILWQVTDNVAAQYDSIQIKDSAGNLMAWFYTSCSCDTEVGAAAVPSGEHWVRVWMWNYYVPGGLQVSFHPNSGAFIGATAPAWIPWSSIGW